MTGSRLQEGWRHVRLGDVLRLRREIVHPGHGQSGERTFVGLEHIESQTGRRIGSDRLELAELTGRKPVFRTGDIVYGYLRPYLNKVWVAEFDGLCSVDQYVYEVDGEQADPHYIAWFIRSPVFLQRAPISETPGQLPRIRLEEIAVVSLALPPQAIQSQRRRAIAEEMATVERTRAAAHEQWRATRSFRHALSLELMQALSGQPTQRLSALLRAPLRTGVSKPSRIDSSVHCLTLSSVREGGLDLTKRKPVDLTADEAGDNWIKPRAFYVVRGNGNLSLVGRGALAPEVVTERVLYPDLLIEVLTDPDVIDPIFLAAVWNSAVTRDQIEQRSRTSAGIFKINQRNLGEITLPVPSLPTQRRLGQMFTERSAEAARLQLRAEEAIAAVDALPGAVLHRAFAGHL